jgi:2-haloacid dehalogenase
MRLTDYQALSFDCYGTLVDWESGILSALQPMLARASSALTPQDALEAFGRHESAQQASTPSMLYRDVLASVHGRLAREWNVTASDDDNRRFAASIARWPPFPDTVEALRYLKRHFRLIILSNVDRESFSATGKLLGVEFDAVCTAQDIGSYKPDPRNFAFLLAAASRLGVAPSQLLHVAESLFHDHAPANRAGIDSVWIHRRHERSGSGATRATAEMPRFLARFTSLGELARAHGETLAH